METKLTLKLEQSVIKSAKKYAKKNKRQPFYNFAAEVFTLGDTGIIELVTTSLLFANVFHIVRKILGTVKAKELLRKMRIMVSIISIEEKIVDLALNSKFADFEDGVQYFTALKHNIHVLLTGNVKDYKEKDVIIQTPEEYLKSNVHEDR